MDKWFLLVGITIPNQDTWISCFESRESAQEAVTITSEHNETVFRCFINNKMFDGFDIIDLRKWVNTQSNKNKGVAEL